MQLPCIKTAVFLCGFSFALVKCIHNQAPLDDVDSATISRNAIKVYRSAASMSVKGKILEPSRAKAILHGFSRALRKLLIGTVPVPINSRVYREYEKAGDWATAKKEFYSVKPLKVVERHSNSHTLQVKTHTGSVLSGTVGDRRLVLKEADEYGRPTLEVIDVQSTAGPFIDKIVYRRAAKWRNY